VVFAVEVEQLLDREAEGAQGIAGFLDAMAGKDLAQILTVAGKLVDEDAGGTWDGWLTDRGEEQLLAGFLLPGKRIQLPGATTARVLLMVAEVDAIGTVNPACPSLDDSLGRRSR
jgi:hypothetical protein